MSERSGKAVIQNSPTLDEWRELFTVAIRVKELAPWQWMEENAVFGVRNPETGELGFVSVMGALGEHYAVALYLGPTGLYRFWEMHGEEEVAAEACSKRPNSRFLLRIAMCCASATVRLSRA